MAQRRSDPERRTATWGEIQLQKKLAAIPEIVAKSHETSFSYMVTGMILGGVVIFFAIAFGEGSFLKFVTIVLISAVCVILLLMHENLKFDIAKLRGPMDFFQGNMSGQLNGMRFVEREQQELLEPRLYDW